MRVFLLIALIATLCEAQENDEVLPPATALGHALVDPEVDQISIEVSLTSASSDLFRELKQAEPIRLAPPTQQAKLPSGSDEMLKQNNGIQLVSATSVLKKRQPVFVKTLTCESRQHLLQLVKQDANSNTMFAPKVTLFDGQTAEIKDSVSRPFVVGVKPNGGQPEPEIQILEDGTRIELRAVSQPTGIRLDISINVSKVENVNVVAAGSLNRQVQVPEVRAIEIRLSAFVPTGQSLAILGFPITAEVESTKSGIRTVSNLSGMFSRARVARISTDLLVIVTPTVLELND